MFKYKLKAGQESFTPVEGPFAGRSFARGQLYGEIPPGQAGKFEEINKAAPARSAAASPAKAEGKKPATAAPSGKAGGKS